MQPFKHRTELTNESTEKFTRFENQNVAQKFGSLEIDDRNPKSQIDKEAVAYGQKDRPYTEPTSSQQTITKGRNEMNTITLGMVSS